MTETFDLTPQGLLTAEGAKRVSAAAQELESATVLLANGAAEFFNEHRMTLLGTASDDPALREAIHQMHALMGARARKQNAFLAAVAGQPPVDVVHHELIELQYADPDKTGPWALYIFGDDGLHSG